MVSTPSDPAALLAQRLQASLLPGDGDMAPQELADAAAFLLATAGQRRCGAMALAIQTVSPSPPARRFMRIAVINEDMPFLVDSIASTISAQGHIIDRLIHPVMAALRDDSGRLTALSEPGTHGAEPESMIYIETRRADARARAALAAALEMTLADVRAAVADWPAMQTAMSRDADRLAMQDRHEGAALLHWFHDGMLTQLGHEMRQRDGRQTDALGICRTSSPDLLSEGSLNRAFAWFDSCLAQDGGRWPLAVKSNHIATVHRRVPLDLFLVPVVAQGRVEALSIHAGTWTSAALTAPPALVPRMRARLSKLMAKHGFATAGHAGKTLVHALTKLPYDLLIGFSDQDLERVTLTMMSLMDRPRPRLVLAASPLERHIFAFVWLPRDALSTTVRLDVGTMLAEAANAWLLDWSLDVEGSNLAQLLFIFAPAIAPTGHPPHMASEYEGDMVRPDEAALDARLQMMLRGWVDAVEAELAVGEDAARAAAIATRHAPAFPLAYRSLYGAAEAATDITRLRRLSVHAGEDAPLRGVRLYRLPGDGARRLRLKVYQRRGVLTLSGAVPALENFGFQVLDTIPTMLSSPGHETDATYTEAPWRSRLYGRIHDFLLALPAGSDMAAIIAHQPAIEDAMAGVANGTQADDRFNVLIVTAGLSVQEAGWLRVWHRYLRQVGMNFATATVVEALAAAPGVTRGITDLFRARHQPGLTDRDTAEARAEAAIRAGLAGVLAMNDDRLLRNFHALVLAILRTNVFTPATDGPSAGRDTAMAFKFDSALVPGLPKPVPWREIFVYSARVEGIHLRAGPIARGGIRWSDRHDDFRTEILGLMKAQRVKNAVIVPTGAKGGFCPKHLPDPAQDRDGWAAEGRAAYQIFVRALLSLTDNIVDGAVVHPAGMVVHDGDDPYFVVAADKGTATFSDTANSLAKQADFWLNDAFASGGSKGYDHKAMAITARGAWLSVQRHFHELGTDIQTTPVRVAGVGDMSGDVFGNGMLLSTSLKLVAAFDHRHIFLDPDPDPALSYTERARLFALPRSSWDDYDRALISHGGGIFPRSQKDIPLTDEIRHLLGITAPHLDPEALIRAILAAPVDLLWFGGIGTYVRADHENLSVGDPANDAIRIHASAVRARVIGEGANLGCTQAARIQYALAGGGGTGGRNNTDFIDNSAGVDCSDKEVNIKIALASARRAGRLTEDERVALLTRMTDDVAALVLEDNRLQVLCLSIAEAGGAAAAPAFTRLIETLEDGGHLDRETEGLADADTLNRRAAEGRGLTRPELAVLLSSAKLAIQNALEQAGDAAGVVDDEGLADELFAAFPTAMRAVFHEDIIHHRLRREILATRIANRMINRLGFVHPFELAEEAGVGLADIAGAFIAAERLFDMAAIWQAIEAETMGEEARILLFTRAAQALRTHMADVLRAATPAPVQAASALAAGVRQLAAAIQTVLTPDARAQSLRMQAELTATGAPAALAARVAALFDLDGAIGLARLAQERGADITSLTDAFTQLGSRLGLDWAQGVAARMNPSDPWARLLVSGLARDFQQMRLDFLRGLDPADAGAHVAHWLHERDALVRPFRAMTDRARAQSPVTPVILAQIASQARHLLSR